MSFSTDKAKGSVIYTADARLIPKPWKLNYGDVFLKKVYVSMIIPNPPIYRYDDDASEYITLSNESNMFDNKIDTYSSGMLKFVRSADYPSTGYNKVGSLYIYLNVPLKCSEIQVIMSNMQNGPVNTIAGTSGDLTLAVVYEDGTISQITQDTKYTVDIPKEGEDDLVEATIFNFKLDSSKKIIGIALDATVNSYNNDPTASPTTPNPFTFDIHGFYIYPSEGETSLGNVGILDSSDTRINPPTKENQDTAITYLNNIESKVATETTLNSVLGQLDITLSALRDALEGTDSKTMTDIVNGLSDKATEATVNSILGQLDITLSALRDALTGTGSKSLTDVVSDLDSILSKLDVNLSTRATESTLSSVLGQLDITLSALRDAIIGLDSRTLTDLYNKINSILTRLNSDSMLKQVEDGESFAASGTIESLADGSSKYFLVDFTGLPSGEKAIMDLVSASLETKAWIIVYAGPTITDNGTELPSFNTNGTSSNTASVKVYEDPTYSAKGTQMHKIYMPGGDTGGWFPEPYGALAAIFSKRMMDNTKKVLIEINNISGYTMYYGSIMWRWHEGVS